MAACGRCKDRGWIRKLHGLDIEPCPSCVGAKEDDGTAKAKVSRQRTQAISSASGAQRKKIAKEGVCRNCGVDERIVKLDPAHVVGRDLGGCDDPLCTISLCRICHDAQETGGVDVLPLLSLDEQAHGVSHVGTLRFLHLATGERYSPDRKDTD